VRKSCVSSCDGAHVVSNSHEKISVRARNSRLERREKLRDGQTMKALELKPEDLPMTVRLKTHSGSKDYVLVVTKQEKLLLNKPLGSTREQ